MEDALAAWRYSWQNSIRKVMACHSFAEVVPLMRHLTSCLTLLIEYLKDQNNERILHYSHIPHRNRGFIFLPYVWKEPQKDEGIRIS